MEESEFDISINTPKQSVKVITPKITIIKTGIPHLFTGFILDVANVPKTVIIVKIINMIFPL